ncbi:hypothetical protein ACFLUM_01810 [Chloroflexota bacterium]
MKVIREVRSMLDLSDDDVLSFRRIHSSRYSTGHVLRTGSNAYYIKEYQREDYEDLRQNHPEYYMRPERALAIEIDCIERMNAVRVEGILTPSIAGYDLSALVLILDYVDSCGFNRYLLRRCNRIRFRDALRTSFLRLGEYLAKFHNMHHHGSDAQGRPICYLHGDLNNKNVRFTDDSLFLFDPSKWRTSGSIYRDIGRLLLLFHPFNRALSVLLSQEGLLSLKRSFLESYMLHSDFELELASIREFMVRVLKEHQDYTRGSSPLKKRTLANLMISSSASRMLRTLRSVGLNDAVGYVDDKSA